MPLSSARRRMIVSGLAALVVLSGRGASGQQPETSTSANGAPPLGLGLGHAPSSYFFAALRAAR
jgi:hypothetical protein